MIGLHLRRAHHEQGISTRQLMNSIKIIEITRGVVKHKRNADARGYGENNGASTIVKRF